MLKIKNSVRAALNLMMVNMDHWLRTPRTWMMLLAAAVVCFTEISKLNRIFKAIHFELNTAEMVFMLTYEGFNFLLSGTFFFITVNEMPRQLHFQYDMLLRSGKKKWLNSQVYYCITVVLAYIFFLLITGFIMSLFFTPWGTKWNSLLNADQLDLAMGALSPDIIKSCSPVQAIFLSVLPTTLLLITISMFLLFTSLTGSNRIGILIICFCMFADAINIQMDIPVSMTEYASLYGLSAGEDILKRLSSVCGSYIMTDIFLYVLMRKTVSHTDFHFQRAGKY